MNANDIKNVVIVGGGTAGWMAAAMLSKSLGNLVNIKLVESDQIGTIGVGEATIPPIQFFNAHLGFDEDDFLKKTKSTIKLGIEFQNWGNPGEKYMHAFGPIGRNVGIMPFHLVWLKCMKDGTAKDISQYSFNSMAAYANKFTRITNIPNTPLEGLSHAYHFDAGLYAQYIRSFCEKWGVKRVEGKITKTNLRPADGFIESVTLESGETIEGDLFVDCSGIRALLIEQALETGYEDWTHWLPCNRALAVPCSNDSPMRPYTQSIAHGAGWQWRIPLQHRTGNGHVYCSDHISDDEATSILLDNLEGEPLKDPMLIKFTTGRRKKIWNKNCISLGLSSGFMEPLESTSIHLIQVGVSNLLKYFPSKSNMATNCEQFNRRMIFEYETIRDFIILHYSQTEREDTPFWKMCKEMDIPESLKLRMDAFEQAGHLYRLDNECFTESSWLQVMLGQGLTPKEFNPIADSITSEEAADYLENLNTIFTNAVTKLPSHKEFISQFNIPTK